MGSAPAGGLAGLGPPPSCSVRTGLPLGKMRLLEEALLNNVTAFSSGHLQSSLTLGLGDFVAFGSVTLGARKPGINFLINWYF